MCEQGINLGQMKLAVGQADDELALVQQWLEQLHHLADHGHQPDASADIAQASVLLGEARAKLETAIDALAGNSGKDVSVELL
jgi:multidrug resistance efflux pump